MKRYVDEASRSRRRRARDLVGHGLRSRLREGYTAKDFRADVRSALVVGVVALPLSMALAIACDVPPQHGLYTAIIAGLLCSLLGGTRFQITGPTAALVVVLLPVVHQFGLAGLLVAGMMAGIMLVVMGVARLGRLMQYVPHPVTTGFTMGIAVAIVLFELKDVFGLRGSLPPTEGTFDYLGAVWNARDSINSWDLGICAVTIGLLAGLPKLLRRVPAPLVALVVVSVLVAIAAAVFPAGWHFHATTIGSKFSSVIDGEVVRGLPPLPPLPVVPWHESAFALDYHTIRELLPYAFAIAMLGAIESLMTAVVADGMSGSKHDPDAELIALGIGNLVCPCFGGIAATGALARTATNIRAGARSPLAAALHAIFVLACTIALAPLVSYLPMAALAALLIVVAYNMAEARHFVRLARIAPRSDVVVMLTCFVLVVAVDAVIAIEVGVVLAALLFMQRMTALTKVVLEPPWHRTFDVPPGVRVYSIDGPLFFGAAKTAMEVLHTVGDTAHTVILEMANVPAMDATGLVALESALDRLYRARVKVIFAGLTAEVTAFLDRAGIQRTPGKLAYAPDVETAISMAIVHAARTDRLDPKAAA